MSRRGPYGPTLIAPLGELAARAPKEVRAWPGRIKAGTVRDQAAIAATRTKSGLQERALMSASMVRIRKTVQQSAKMKKMGKRTLTGWDCGWEAGSTRLMELPPPEPAG